MIKILLMKIFFDRYIYIYDTIIVNQLKSDPPNFKWLYLFNYWRYEKNKNSQQHLHILKFSKINIVVPRNATKTTKTTLCDILPFSLFGPKSHILVTFLKYQELICAIFSERVLDLKNRFLWFFVVYGGFQRFFEVFGPKPANENVEN